MIEKLKPCPFCGSEDIAQFQGDHPAIRCDGCGLMVTSALRLYADPKREFEILTEAWDRRVTEKIGKELKPCPFCGGETTLESRYGQWLVYCKNWECRVTSQTYVNREDAIDRWNRRYDE